MSDGSVGESLIAAIAACAKAAAQAAGGVSSEDAERCANAAQKLADAYETLAWSRRNPGQARR